MSATQEMQQLKDAGFTDEEIGNWAVSQRKTLSDAGFGNDEINAYFGHPSFKAEPIKALVDTNIQAATQPTGEGGEPKPVTSFLEAAEAGLQLSNIGLLIRGEQPNKVVAEDAPRSSRIAGNVGTLLGDIPSMAAGALIGSSGGPITATAGAFALPSGVRKILMDKYEKGEVETFQDFWDRASGAVIETAKQWVVGAATGAAGKAVGAVPIASPTAKAAATLGAEVTTMVAVGSALEGKVPNADDFLDAAIILGGVKGSVRVAKKLREVYAKTGVTPQDAVQDASRDASIAQDLLSSDVAIPTAYGKMETASEPTPTQEPPPTVPEPGTIAADQQAILKRIVQKDADTEGLNFEKLYTAFVDNLNPIKLAEKEAGGKRPTGESPYDLERLTRGIYGKGTEFIERGAFDFDTYETVTRGYQQILEPVKDDLDGFRAYMVAKRALELEDRDIESGMPIEEAKRVVAAGRKTYEPVFRERSKYRSAMLDYLKKSGILTDKQVEAMEELGKDYVPFYRSFEPQQDRPTTGKKVGNPIKRIVGSTDKILDPIVSDIKDTYLFISLAEKNAARQKFVALGPEFAKPVKMPHEDVLPILQDAGLTKEQIKALSIMRPENFQAGKDEIVVYHDGKRQLYKVDPDVADAFNQTDKDTAGFLANMLHGPASLLRAGVTTSPDFFGRNIMRDAISAFIYSGSNPIKTAKGLKSIVTKDTAFQNWMKAGGANATLVAMDRDYISQNLLKLDTETGLMQRGINVLKTPIDLLRALSELTENATRLGSVRDDMGQAKTKAQMQALALISREATVDFARHGQDPFFREWTRSAAFMNPGIQGLDRMVRAYHENPKGMVAKSLAAVTLPSLLLWWANHDDPRWKEIPRWQKDLFWIVMTKDHIFRLPKPFTEGVLWGTLPERLLDRFGADNPDGLKDMDRTIGQAFGFNLMPTFAVPILDQYANRSAFTGSPLIPGYLEKMMPEYQYTEYTTDVAKALGKIMGAFPGLEREAIQGEPGSFTGGLARALTTPILVDNYVRSWTGGIGMYVLQLADQALRKSGAVPDPVKPAATLSDIPVVKAFTVRYPSASAESIQSFIDSFTAKDRVWATAMAKAKEGDAAGVQRAMEFDRSAMAPLREVRQTLTELGQYIRLINKNADMTPEEKRQLIDTAYFRMIEIAQYGNEALRAIEKAVNENP